MAVDFDKFLDWAENRFPVVKVKGSEIKVDSIFVDDDHKQHLWCNPYGGKHDRENGVFHCWKTDKRGSLVTLVMLVDHCSYEEALEILDTGDASMIQLERQLEQFLNDKYYGDRQEEVLPQEKKIKLPDFSYPILELSPNNLYRVQAEMYLFNRGLSPDGLWVCIGGKYCNRIIIPYFDRQQQLIYWNGRYIGSRKDVLRYQGPDKDDFGVGKDDVLYVPIWPDAGERIYLTEGEFDALTLKMAGMRSGAFGGKNISDSQITMLDDYRVTLCLDNDEAGRTSLSVMGDKLKAWGFVDVRFVRPPKQFKDWNEMLGATTPKLIAGYIRLREKHYTVWTSDELAYQSIR
jgi:hypothetical protein